MNQGTKRLEAQQEGQKTGACGSPCLNQLLARWQISRERSPQTIVHNAWNRMVNNGLTTGSSFGNPSPQPGLGQGREPSYPGQLPEGDSASPPAWQHLQK